MGVVVGVGVVVGGVVGVGVGVELRVVRVGVAETPRKGWDRDVV